MSDFPSNPNATTSFVALGMRFFFKQISEVQRSFHKPPSPVAHILGPADQHLGISDSQNLRFADSQTLRISESQILRVSESQHPTSLHVPKPMSRYPNRVAMAPHGLILGENEATASKKLLKQRPRNFEKWRPEPGTGTLVKQMFEMYLFIKNTCFNLKTRF